MAKSSNRTSYREWVKDEPEVIEFSNEDLAKEGSPSTPLVLTKDLKLNITGPGTGIVYTFNGAGSVVYVDERDVPGLLSKAQKHSCCGNMATPYFLKLEG